jgi:hypothetical protein
MTPLLLVQHGVKVCFQPLVMVVGLVVIHAGVSGEVRGSLILMTPCC